MIKNQIKSVQPFTNITPPQQSAREQRTCTNLSYSAMASFIQSFIQSTKANAVIVVDPISSGRELAHKLIHRGWTVIAVWSIASQKVTGIGDCDLQFEKVVFEVDGDIESTIDSIKNLDYKVDASIVGCESGVELNDIISERLLLPSNGTSLSVARRDKWTMQERIKECGLRGIKQMVAANIDEVVTFVNRERLRKWIMKPRRDAGSNGVFKCETIEEAHQAFERITKSQTIFGERNNDVLIQEFLEGTEYVIDTVSCAGEHKAVAIWEQDKRTVHGSPFVYYDSHLFETDDGAQEQQMFDYICLVLDALGVRFGSGHAEVMWLADEETPCLVEVGTRPHGAGGNFPSICDPVIGYNQLDATIDAYLNAENFATIPRLPANLKGMGVEYFFICYKDGILEGMDFTMMEKLGSYLGVDMHRVVGEKVSKTVDLVTSPGVVRLAHSDKNVVNREKMELRSLEESIFTISTDKTAEKLEEVSTEEAGADIAPDS